MKGDWLVIISSWITFVTWIYQALNVESEEKVKYEKELKKLEAQKKK